jgi:hypothetical protein
MSAAIISTFVDGREAQRVACDCGWKSASLWADQNATVIAYWAEAEAESHSAEVTIDRRAAAAERDRLRGQLDRLDRERESVAAALARIS